MNSSIDCSLMASSTVNRDGPSNYNGFKQSVLRKIKVDNFNCN